MRVLGSFGVSTREPEKDQDAIFVSTWNSSYSVSMRLMKFCLECRVSRAQRTLRGKEVAIDVRLVALGRH